MDVIGLAGALHAETDWRVVGGALRETCRVNCGAVIHKPSKSTRADSNILGLQAEDAHPFDHHLDCGANQSASSI